MNKKMSISHLLFFLVSILPILFSCQKEPAAQVILPEHPGVLGRLAAHEVRKYIYLRSGELPEIRGSMPVTSSGDKICLQVDKGLGEQEFSLKTRVGGSNKTLIISGGSEQAVLYGAYEFAEQLGIRFYLHGDVIPDEKVAFEIPELDIHKKPVFELRGIQPFHDFPEGPDWWNENDYAAIIGQLAKLKMNFIGFHNYPERINFTGGGAKAEPLVWIGKEEDANPDGTVKSAYPVLHFHTADSTWGYHPTKTSDFRYGAAQLFESDNFGADYMKGVSGWPHTEEENIQLFNRVGEVFRNSFTLAKKMGIKTCVGTETPITIPGEMKKRYGIDKITSGATHQFYKGIFSRIRKTYPLDYYWLWTPEYWTLRGASDEDVAKAEQDMLQAYKALEETGNPFTLATCGWVLGPPKDRAQFDRVLPKEIPFSCINRWVGYAPVDKGFQAVEGRQKWAIPWMEDDPALLSSQLWAGRLRKDAYDAYRYGCNGLFGIHWRTRILGPNISSLAKAAWECDKWQVLEPDSLRDLPVVDFYTDWVKTQFGISDTFLVNLFVRLDSRGFEKEEMNKGDSPLKASEWDRGPGGLMVAEVDEGRISRYDFLDGMEAARGKIKGMGTWNGLTIG